MKWFARPKPSSPSPEPSHGTGLLTPPADALIERGEAVVYHFRGEPHFARSDPRSGYVFFDPPSSEVLADYYANEYGRGSDSKYTIEVAYDPARCDQVASHILDVASSYGISAPFRIHELGCSFGGVVDELARRGLNATGSDLNSDAIEQGRRRGNMHIDCSSNISALEHSEPLDVVYANHCLEHDPRLADVLKLIAQRLTPRGILIANVPNAMYIGALVNGFLSFHWTAYPDHLHMLSPGHVPLVCSDGGLACLRVSTSVPPGQMAEFASVISDSDRVEVWRHLMSGSGFGTEIRFVACTLGSAVAGAFASDISALDARLTEAREFEIGVRAMLRG